MSRIIGYEVGGFHNGRFVDLADCMACFGTREAKEQERSEWAERPNRHPATEYRVLEIREAS